MDNEKKIEEGLAFIRKQLMKRLKNPKGDSSTTELALAALALISARESGAEEHVSILKFPSHLTAVRRTPLRSVEPVGVASSCEPAPYVIRFEEASKEVPTSRDFGASSCAYARQGAPALKLYCED